MIGPYHKASAMHVTSFASAIVISFPGYFVTYPHYLMKRLRNLRLRPHQVKVSFGVCARSTLGV